jgi:2-succinyl-5-enolpyruvyl-6-hydroxy-3-cyclohexene-1-carboxylate synthase
VAAGCRALTETLGSTPEESFEAMRHEREVWSRRFQDAEAAAWAASDEVLGRQSTLSEGATARRLVEALPEGSLLSLGNSLPIRQVDRWVPPASKSLRILSQRGTSGIDGLVSAAAGATTTLPPATAAALLLGDLSLLHDVGGLAVAARLRRPLVIVVVNNQGGRIFEQLPIVDVVTPEVFGHWLTPQEWDLSAASSAFRLPHHPCSTVAELDAALEAALKRPGATVIEALVPASGAREDHRHLQDALAQQHRARSGTPGDSA